MEERLKTGGGGVETDDRSLWRKPDENKKMTTSSLRIESIYWLNLLADGWMDANIADY